MRWCCGGGSSNTSSLANINNHQGADLAEETLPAVTPSTMMTELSFKSGKNSTKISKLRNGKSKKNDNANEKHCVLQQHDNDQNVQLSGYESGDTGDTGRRGVLKSSLKLLQSRNSSKSVSQRVTKGVQYADEVRLREETVDDDTGKGGLEERVKLLQNDDTENMSDLLVKRSSESELGGVNGKNHFYNNTPLQQQQQHEVDNKYESASFGKGGRNSFSDFLPFNAQSPTKQSHFSSASPPMYKQNHPFLFPQHNQNFDKYGPMLVKTCKTAIYFCSNISSTIVLQPKPTSTDSTHSCSGTSPPISGNENLVMLEELQKAGWIIFISNHSNATREIHNRRPVLILVDEKIDDFSTFLRSLKQLPECEDVLISPFLEHFPTEERLQNLTNFQQFFLYSNVDISFCEMFARITSRLRAMPALFALIEEAEQPIKICDKNNIAQYVNRAYELSTGKSRVDVLGLHSSEIRDKSILPTGNTAVSGTLSGNSTAAATPITEEISEFTSGVEKNSQTGNTTNTLLLLAQTSSIGAASNCNRRKSNEWHCITVPSCSTTSPQFVYVKRGSTDAIGRDLSLKSLRSQSGLVEAPITEALNVLDSVVSRCDDSETQLQIRDAIKILSSTELYAPTITRFRDNDRIASGYYDGLIRLHHPSRQRKRSVVDAFRENQQRRVSGGSSHSGVSSHDGSGATRRRISTDVVNALENENSWSFDVIELERITEHRPLSQLGVKIFERWNVTETLRCSIDNVARWLQVIEANYQSGNAYHNATHAADVLQATSFFLNSDAVGQYVQDQHAVSALIAATVHDLDHPGRGNAFLMNTRSRLAVLYNDHSVLENHHVALAFQLTLTQPGVNIFSRLPGDEFSQIRQATIDMVLATDMSRHFEYLTKFQQILGILPDAEENRDANSLTICRMMIKCADIVNPTREWKLCYQWAMRIVVEYFEQTAEEVEKNLPLTMKGFDCETCNIPLTQCTFVDMFAREAFTSWCDFAELPQLLTQLESNYERWKGQAAGWDPKQNATMLQKRQGGLWR